MAEPEPATRAWQEPGGEIVETYALAGEGIQFNLEGLPFVLPAFVLALRRDRERVLGLNLHIPALDPVNLLQLGALIPLPRPGAEIRRARSADLTLALKPELVQTVLAPAWPRLRTLEQLLQLRTADGAHLLLDFYHYDLQALELVMEAR